MSSKSEQDEFLWHVHGHQTTFIQFADAKAGLVIAWNGAQLAYLLNTGAIQVLIAEFSKGRFWSISFVLTLAALIFLVAGMCLSFLVLMPNLFQRRKSKRNDPTSELIFWESIDKLECEEYRRRVLATDDYLGQVASHIHELAGIANSKYKRLKRAFYTSFVAMVCVVLCTIAIQFNNSFDENPHVRMLDPHGKSRGPENHQFVQSDSVRL